jgi:hypothetical protein
VFISSYMFWSVYNGNIQALAWEEEKENKINFLDYHYIEGKEQLFIRYIQKTHHWHYNINVSCHLLEHKLAAIRYLTNWKETYNLNATNKGKANNITNHILHNNKYDISLSNKLTRTEKKYKLNTLNTKWAKFTCVVKETKFITKLFKNNTLKIAFTTQSTTGKLLSKQTNHRQRI